MTWKGPKQALLKGEKVKVTQTIFSGYAELLDWLKAKGVGFQSARRCLRTVAGDVLGSPIQFQFTYTTYFALFVSPTGCKSKFWSKALFCSLHFKTQCFGLKGVFQQDPTTARFARPQWPRRSERPASHGPPASDAHLKVPCKTSQTFSETTASMASEAAEAGLIPPMTCLTMSRGRMQSLNLLALKLWICIAP